MERKATSRRIAESIVKRFHDFPKAPSEEKKLKLMSDFIRSAALIARLNEGSTITMRRANDALMSYASLRDLKKGRYVPIKTPRTEDGKSLQFYFRWHNSNGDITGRMMRQWGPKAHEEDMWESIVTITNILRNKPSRAVNAWKRALGK